MENCPCSLLNIFKVGGMDPTSRVNSVLELPAVLHYLGTLPRPQLASGKLCCLSSAGLAAPGSLVCTQKHTGEPSQGAVCVVRVPWHLSTLSRLRVESMHGTPTSVLCRSCVQKGLKRIATVSRQKCQKQKVFFSTFFSLFIHINARFGLGDTDGGADPAIGGGVLL